MLAVLPVILLVSRVTSNVYAKIVGIITDNIDGNYADSVILLINTKKNTFSDIFASGEGGKGLNGYVILGEEMVC